MDSNPKYSVIIPIFNAERTLRRCVNSLILQDYDSAEIILVNDGSTDASGTICDEFAQSDERIVYISKGNGGVSSARNCGLDAAKGKYVLFVDSDDLVMEGYFRQLDSLDPEERYDFLWFSYAKSEEGNITGSQLSPCIVEDPRAVAQMFSKALWQKTINSPCNKRYRRPIIRENAIRFHEKITIGEDTLFNLQYAINCRNCRVSDMVLYTFFTDNQQSLSRDKNRDYREQFRMLDDATIRLIQDADIANEYRKYYVAAFNFKKISSVYSDAKKMHKTQVNRKTRFKRIRSMCIDVRGNIDPLPDDLRCKLLRIPVQFKMTAIIDLMGKVLAR